MAEKKKAKTQAKPEKIEREYVIPFRKKVGVVPRYKRANKTIKTIKEFLARHMKVYDRDLNKIKIDGFLNEQIWARGIKRPPHKIKVRAVKEGDIVRVEAAELPEKMKFKKARLEKLNQKAKEILEGKKSKMAKAKETMAGKGAEETGKEEAEKKEEEKEKKAAVVEAGKEMAKEQAKKVRHEAKAAGKATKQKHQQRKTLAK